VNSPADMSLFVVVDSGCRIKYVSDGGEGKLGGVVADSARLEPEIETLLRDLDRRDRSLPLPSTSLGDDRLLRVTRLHGEGDALYVLSIEEDWNRVSLTRAVRRYQLTRRETSVLTLILDGWNAGEIAETLCISEYTVQGYFKRLLAKTDSRNRASMVANILNWNAERRAGRRGEFVEVAV